MEWEKEYVLKFSKKIFITPKVCTCLVQQYREDVCAVVNFVFSNSLAPNSCTIRKNVSKSSKLQLRMCLLQENPQEISLHSEISQEK